MSALKTLRLRNSIESPALAKPERLDQSRDRDRFDISKDDVQLDVTVYGVRIVGRYGVSLQPWANILEAWEADEPATTTGTAQAAAPKARGATSK